MMHTSSYPHPSYTTVSMKDKSCLSHSWCLAYVKQIAGHQSSVYWVTVFYGHKCTATKVSCFAGIQEKACPLELLNISRSKIFIIFSILLREGGQRKAFSGTLISCALHR